MSTRNHPSPALVGVIVAFSGFCSLVYQVVWDRTLKYNFGGDSISSAIVTGTFLLGLGIGAFVFGKWRQRPFNTYALVEMSIGAYAISSYYLLAPMGAFLGQLFSYSIVDTEGLRLTVVFGSILFLLLPCILMGGTLPLMFNCFIRTSSYSNRTVGLVYGLNTTGAAIGIVAAPFLFLNRISLPNTLLIVGGANMLLGVGVWLYGRHIMAAENTTPPATATPTAPPPTGSSPTDIMPRLWLLQGLAFASGFVTLAYEISLFRTMGIVARSSPYTFPLVLMPFLLALALGSIVFTRFSHYSTRQAIRRVGSLFVLAAIAMLVGVITKGLFDFNKFDVLSLLTEAELLLPSLLMIFPFAFLQGGIFPLLLRLASNRGEDLPRQTGLIYLANAIGSFLGAMLAQFYGFPYLGSQGLITSLFLLGLIAGLACLLWATQKAALRNAIAVAGLLLAITALLIPKATWDIYTFKHTGPTLDRFEGVSGVATIRWDSDNERGRVSVNGQLMSFLPNHPKHAGMAAIALALPRRENVLILGLGGGTMIKTLLTDPTIQRIDVIDWSHELPQVLESPRAKATLGEVLHDPRVRVFSADARVAVSLYQDNSFDVAIDNLAIIGWAGSTGVKSTAYFAEIARILEPTGVFIFGPNYAQPPSREAVLTGLLQHFNHVHEETNIDVIVLAANQPLQFNLPHAEQVLADHAADIGLTPPYLAWLTADFKPIATDALNNTPPIVDDLLIYEYTLLQGTLPGLGPSALPTPTPQQAITLDPALFDKYVGQYQFTPDYILTVSRRANQLLAHGPDQPETPILPISETTFFVRQTNIRLEFVVDGAGQVTGLGLNNDGQRLVGQKIR